MFENNLKRFEVPNNYIGVRTMNKSVWKEWVGDPSVEQQRKDLIKTMDVNVVSKSILKKKHAPFANIIT